jgi:hypothetical protein
MTTAELDRLVALRIGELTVIHPELDEVPVPQVTVEQVHNAMIFAREEGLESYVAGRVTLNEAI